jgi:FKBP-type peptidyl-prolyl cis-trans isomerase
MHLTACCAAVGLSLLACNNAKPAAETDEAKGKAAEEAANAKGKAETTAAPAANAGDIPAPPDVAAPPADAPRTPSQLATKVLSAGTGTDKPKRWDEVKVHYTGWTTDGKMFDSSVKRGEPTKFGVEQVIAGWTEGLQLMVVGEKRRMWIPEDLAYKGKPGRPAGMLVFDVELLEIVPGKEPIPAPSDVAAAPENATKTESGLQYVVLAPGEAAKAKEHPSKYDRVTVHYTGWQTDGKMFDSSVQRGTPSTFGVGQVIEGWTEGLQLMSPGSKYRFWIPENLAYKGRSGPPAGMLVFDVELISIQKMPEPPPVPKDVAAAPKDAKKTASVLQYKILKKGKGKIHPKPEDRVEVHYTGWTTDGKMFDSSVTRGRPMTFGLNQVIPGWTEGVALLVEGDSARLWVPEDLAYKGRPGAPAGMLVFDVELLKIEPTAPKAPAPGATPPPVNPHGAAPANPHAAPPTEAAKPAAPAPAAPAAKPAAPAAPPKGAEPKMKSDESPVPKQTQ